MVINRSFFPFVQSLFAVPNLLPIPGQWLLVIERGGGGRRNAVQRREPNREETFIWIVIALTGIESKKKTISSPVALPPGIPGIPPGMGGIPGIWPCAPRRRRTRRSREEGRARNGRDIVLSTAGGGGRVAGGGERMEVLLYKAL